MSRYTKKVKEKGYELAWGYDEALQEYFFHKYKLDAPDDEEDVIFAISSVYTLDYHPDYPGKMRFSNGEILECMEPYKKHLPEEHLHAIALDAPF